MGCMHDQTLEDFHTGDIICLNCAVVLDKLQLSPFSYTSTIDSRKKQSSNDVKLLVEDILASLFIFSTDIIEQCSLRCIHFLSTLGKKFNRDDIIAFGIYEGLCTIEIPCSPLDICRICNIKENTLLKLEKETNCAIKPCPPALFVNKICSSLCLPYFIEKKVKEEVILRQKSTLSKPESLIGSIILLEVERLRKKGENSFFFNHITMAEVSKTLGVSETSLYRKMKQLNKN